MDTREMITPYECAEKLADKYHSYMGALGYSESIEAAVIVADTVIEQLGLLGLIPAAIELKQYWEEVRKELENI